MELNKISHNFGIATASRMLVNVFGFLAVAVMTRALGAKGFGGYSTAMAYLFIFNALADMGLQAMLVREISQKPKEEKEIVGKIFTLRLILVIFFAIIANIVIWFLPAVQYTTDIKLGVLVASLFIILSSLVQVLLGVFQKHLRIYYVSIADISMRVLQVTLLVILLLTKSTNLINFLAVVSLAEILHFSMVYYFSRKIVKFKIQVDFVYWKKILRSSIPIAVSLLFVLLYFKIDTFFLSFMRAQEEVGLYAASYKVLEIVIVIPAIFVGLIMPILSKYAIENRRKSFEIFQNTFRILLAMALPASIYLYLLAKPIINIIGGPEFIDASELLRILVPAVFFVFFGNLGGNMFIALHKQRKSMWIYGLGALFNIVGNIIFIPKHGAIAAAWTTVATEGIVTILMFVMLYGYGAKPNLDKRTFYIFASSLITGLAIFFLRDNFWLATAVALIYFPLILKTKAVSKEELGGNLYVIEENSKA